MSSTLSSHPKEKHCTGSSPSLEQTLLILYPYSPTAYAACLGLQLGEPDLRFRAPKPPRSNAHAHGLRRPPQVRDSGTERAPDPWADGSRAPDTRVMTSPRWRAQWLEKGSLWAWGGMKVSPRGIPAEVEPAHSFPGLTVTPRVGGLGGCPATSG